MKAECKRKWMIPLSESYSYKRCHDHSVYFIMYLFIYLFLLTAKCENLRYGPHSLPEPGPAPAASANSRHTSTSSHQPG